MAATPGSVVSVHAGSEHGFSKPVKDQIQLVAGHGVVGDAHCGETVKHRSRVAIDPTQPNLRQVHLIHAELFEALAGQGHVLAPGDLGENITTRGVDLLALPRGAILRIGGDARVELTGLRNPCSQIEAFQPGLLARVVRKLSDGRVERLAGVMGIVLTGGEIKPGDAIHVQEPALPHMPLERV